MAESPTTIEKLNRLSELEQFVANIKRKQSQSALNWQKTHREAYNAGKAVWYQRNKERLAEIRKEKRAAKLAQLPTTESD